MTADEIRASAEEAAIAAFNEGKPEEVWRFPIETEDAVHAALDVVLGERGAPITEPPTRNSVVLLKDGSVARRNTDHLTRNERTWQPPWTHYPTRTLPPALANGATDPGQCVHWSTLILQGVERVLYVAPAVQAEAGPSSQQAEPRDEDRADVPRVGDLAYHISGLDPREVTRVEKAEDGHYDVWLDILGTESGPFSADQYTFEPMQEGTDG